MWGKYLQWWLEEGCLGLPHQYYAFPINIHKTFVSNIHRNILEKVVRKYRSHMNIEQTNRNNKLDKKR